MELFGWIQGSSNGWSSGNSLDKVCTLLQLVPNCPLRLLSWPTPTFSGHCPTILALTHGNRIRNLPIRIDSTDFNWHSRIQDILTNFIFYTLYTMISLQYLYVFGDYCTVYMFEGYIYLFRDYWKVYMFEGYIYLFDDYCTLYMFEGYIWRIYNWGFEDISFLLIYI